MSTQSQSRLGHILLEKGLITQQQLETAISLQISTKQRLGEVLISQGLINAKQLKKALHRQTNLRLTATLVAALLSPFQLVSAETRTAALQSAHDMQPLSDTQMSSYSAQGLDQALQGLLVQAESGNGIETVTQLVKLVNPLLNELEYEQHMSNIVYDTQSAQTAINTDGSINVRLPSNIGEMHFDNIRVKGAPQNQSFGSLSLYNIDLSQASLKIALRP